MKTAHKIVLIVMACLLVVGAMCLAFGIMLGGSVGGLLTAATERISEMLNTFLHIGT